MKTRTSTYDKLSQAKKDLEDDKSIERKATTSKIQPYHDD